MISAFLWGGLAAASLLIGYFVANRGLSNRTIGIIMGIGAGALLSAIAYELIPESALGVPGMALAFGLGAFAFFVGDWIIDHKGGETRKDIAGDQIGHSGAAIFIGTLLDNVPESIILGMSLAIGGVINIAFLAAVFVSNLPEGVAGTVNLETSGYSRKKVFWMWRHWLVFPPFVQGWVSSSSGLCPLWMVVSLRLLPPAPCLPCWRMR